MKNKPTAIAIHGGAGEDTAFIRENLSAYKAGIQDALDVGHGVLENGGTALDAVEAAVCALEDNYLFNAGRGSALNCLGEIEMDVSMMDGEHLHVGGACSLTSVKNPISFAKKVLALERTDFLSGIHADEAAREMGLEMEEREYFVTDEQISEFLRNRKKYGGDDKMFVNHALHGTVGAVALDQYGNIAAGTSTGGAIYNPPGRVGDSCMIGAGTYANNRTCAVSCTGHGEFIIRNVLSHDIAAAVEYKEMTVQEACDYVVHVRNKNCPGDLGVIAVDTKGEIGMAFNTEKMHRGWKVSGEDSVVQIYRD
jgi:beta-aspartyl-peptidase (threonine type)